MFQIIYTMQDGSRAYLSKFWIWGLHRPEEAYLFDSREKAQAVLTTWVKVQVGNEAMKYTTIEKIKT
jgi:hypothetical protein